MYFLSNLNYDAKIAREMDPWWYFAPNLVPCHWHAASRRPKHRKCVFILVYFSVAVCLRGLSSHSCSLFRCTPVFYFHWCCVRCEVWHTLFWCHKVVIYHFVRNAKSGTATCMQYEYKTPYTTSISGRVLWESGSENKLIVVWIFCQKYCYPDSKVLGANMGPTWGR